jgi:hypothetical protein
VDKDWDLLIFAEKAITNNALEALHKEKNDLETFIKNNPNFETTLKPMHVSLFAPKIIRLMAWAAKKANVGPMASVAGALAEHVGKAMLKHSKEMIVENDGDIYIKTNKVRRIGVYAGKSPFSEKIAIEIDPKDTPLGICSSSNTIGHNVSLGNADLVLVTSRSTALADAAATAIGNLVKSEETIEQGLDLAKKLKGLHGVLIIKNDKMGAWGTLKIVSL